LRYNTVIKNVHSVVWKENKWYVAKTLEVEVASQGLNEKEALANLKEALELYYKQERIRKVYQMRLN